MNNTLKNLACVAVILAALAVVGHEMAGRAEAQSGGSPVVALVALDAGYLGVATANGDVWVRQHGPGVASPFTGTAAYLGNIFDAGQPTAVQPQTWSQIKGAYRGQ